MEETEWNKKIKNFTDRINDANLLGQENKHFVCDKIWGWKNLRVEFLSLGFLRVELSDNSTLLFFNFPNISDFYREKVYLYKLAIYLKNNSQL